MCLQLAVNFSILSQTFVKPTYYCAGVDPNAIVVGGIAAAGAFTVAVTAGGGAGFLGMYIHAVHTLYICTLYITISL